MLCKWLALVSLLVIVYSLPHSTFEQEFSLSVWYGSEGIFSHLFEEPGVDRRQCRSPPLFRKATPGICLSNYFVISNQWSWDSGALQEKKHHSTSASCICKFLTVNNLLRANFFRGNLKHIFIFYVIPPHLYDTGGWNLSSTKTRTCPFYIVNIMAAGVLATQGARTSAAMILT